MQKFSQCSNIQRLLSQISEMVPTFNREQYSKNQDNESLSILYIKNTIYELINILELFQPLTVKELVDLFKALKDIHKYEIADSKVHKITTLQSLISLMHRMDIIKNTDDYITASNEITCYNMLFTITRNDFNKYRAEIIDKYSKSDSYRIEVLKNAFNS